MSAVDGPLARPLRTRMRKRRGTSAPTRRTPHPTAMLCWATTIRQATRPTTRSISPRCRAVRACRSPPSSRRRPRRVIVGPPGPMLRPTCRVESPIGGPRPLRFVPTSRLLEPESASIRTCSRDGCIRRLSSICMLAWIGRRGASSSLGRTSSTSASTSVGRPPAEAAPAHWWCRVALGRSAFVRA